MRPADHRPHPDDAEIHVGALIAAHVRLGRSVAVVDATRGEIASRGTPDQRARGAAAAADMLGLCARDQLGLPDGGVPADDPVAPTLLVPASEDDWRRKLPAVRCYGSQLAGGDGPATSLSDPAFLAWIEARGRAWGFQAGTPYAETLCGPEAARIGVLTEI